MSFCNEVGIPHSVFLQKWSPEDRSKARAFMIEKAQRCSLCGTAPWEWEENKFAYTAADDFCRGCYQKAVFSDQESNNLPGTTVKLVPTTPLVKAQMQVNAQKRAQRGD